MTAASIVRPRPYIGVSGVTAHYQVDLIQTLIQESDLDRRRDVLLGVKATHKTLMLDTENKYGADWYPVGDDIGALPRMCFGRPRWIRPVTQVFMEHPADAAYRDEFTARLERHCGSDLHGIQYDLLPWHEPALADGLTRYLADVHGTGYQKVYLQVHAPAMVLGPAEAARRFAPYAEHVDHVLFDSSHGTGQRLDTTRLGEFLDAFSGFEVGVGVAGGLGPDVPLDDLLAMCPHLSWDAEGNLHPPRLDGSRRLDLGRVEDYLRASATLLGTTGQRLWQGGE